MNQLNPLNPWSHLGAALRHVRPRHDPGRQPRPRPRTARGRLAVSVSTAPLQDSPNWVSTTVAGTDTAAIWVRADAPGAVLKRKLQEYTGSTLVASASSQITLTTDWQRVSLAYVVRSPGSTLDTQIYVANPAPGTAFYADDATIVLG
jgi:hypothetical protein